MLHKDALFVAEWLVDELQESCERIEIAGSIRRGKPDVKDIEIVAIPILKPPRPEFGKPIDKTALARKLRWLEYDGMLKHIKGGDKFKQFEIRRLVDFGISEPLNPFKLDLFLVTPPAQWGVQMVIRTGPAEFSQWMVTQKSKGGALPNIAKVRGGAVHARKNQVIPMDEEQDFFAYCSLAWIDPEKRTARWL